MAVSSGAGYCRQVLILLAFLVVQILLALLVVQILTPAEPARGCGSVTRSTSSFTCFTSSFTCFTSSFTCTKSTNTDTLGARPAVHVARRFPGLIDSVVEMLQGELKTKSDALILDAVSRRVAVFRYADVC